MAKLSDILKRRAPLLNLMAPDQTAWQAAEIMAQREVGAVLVAESGALKGIFSERDILRRVVARKLPLEATPLRQVMTQNPITASPDDDRTSAIMKMSAVGCRHLPILLGDQIIDTVSIRDLLFEEIQEREVEIEELKRYIQGG